MLLTPCHAGVLDILLCPPFPADNARCVDAVRSIHVLLGIYVGAPVLFALLCYVMTTPLISVLPHQLLVRKVDGFMPDEEFSRIQNCIRNHPLTGKSVLEDKAFSSTRGFVIGFNRDGISTFKNDVRFECLHSYFDRAVYHGANAFVMNVLVCHIPTNKSDVVVDVHIDNTVRTWYPGITFAHQVNVLYMSVPHDMKGGDLQIFKYGPDPRHEPDGSFKPREEIIRLQPDDSVTPQENMMVAFRGDAYHRVMGYETQTAEKRISLVLEQYQVPSWAYPFTVTFEFFKKGNMDPM